MINLPVNARPKIRDKDYLVKLYEDGIFDKQLDVWAYALAYALKHNLRAEAEKVSGKREEMTDLDHLDRKTLDILLVAVEAYIPGIAEKDDATIITQLSDLASVGLAAIRKETQNKTINEIYEVLLKII